MKKLALMSLFSVTMLPVVSFAQDGIRIEKITVEERQKKEEVSKKEMVGEDIKITRQIDLGEILSNIYPEINFMRKASTANDINIRGFMRDNINVLIDDSKIYGACPNRMDPASFHVSTPQIEKIEVKEGPFDIENAGSLAAVVNVKTKDPKEGIGGEIGATAGSFSYRTTYIWGNVGNRYIKAVVGASNQYSKPYESGEGKKVTEYSIYSTPAGPTAGRYKPQYIDDKAFNIDRVWTKIVVVPNDNAELKLSYAFENARNVLYPALKMDALYDRTNRINLDFSLKDIGLKISTYHNEVKHDMRDTFRTTSRTSLYSMKTYAESKISGIKLVKSLNIYGIDTSFGVEYYLRNWNADNVQNFGSNKNPGMIPDVDIGNFGMFVKGVKDINNWTVSAGLRVDRSKSEADKDAISGNNKVFVTNGLLDSFSKTDTYPSGYILGRYNIDKRNNIYIGFGHTVRVPDPIERYIALSGMAPWYGNPHLKPTKNNEIDLGGEFYPISNLGLKVNLFYSDLTDYIYLRQYKASSDCTGTGSTTCTTYQNIDARIYGGDFGLFYAFNEKISTEFGVAYQKGKKSSGIYTDSDIAEIPPLKSRLALKYDDGRLYGIVEGIYQAKQSNVDTDLKEIETPSYFIVNIKTGYTYANKLSVGFGVDNLFDRLYYNYLSYVRDPFRGISQNQSPIKIPEPGRFVYLNLSYRF